MVTLDELSTGNIEGVKIIYLADFLLKEELKGAVMDKEVSA